MIINNFNVDGKNYPFFPENIKCQSYSLDLEMICIPENLIRDLEIILKKYHISLSQILNARYISNFFSSEEKDIFVMAKKIINGHNPNEVVLIDKIKKNKGFFEKFFNFFN